MLETSARLLRLLTLLQSRATWSGPALTDRLEVTARTLRRDVDRLRALGYPVASTPGPAGGYQLGAGSTLPPLMMDNDEGLAVAIALHASAASVTSTAEAGQRALAKIDQVLPARLRKRLAALRAALVRLPGRAPAIAVGVVDALAGACTEHRVAAFDYRDQQGRGSARSVEPQRLVLADGRWYLAAWDRARADWRSFRVDRIAPPVQLGALFAPRPAPDGDVSSLVAGAVSWRRQRHQARIVFQAPVDVLRAKIPPVYGELTAVDSRRCRFETGGPSLTAIAVWLAITDIPFTVDSPAALAAHVAALGRRLLASAGPNPGAS
ncbi:MAG TPA: YafY family protein [Polyangia bacterium]|nr:YafY family protein [Polyangia bacterium]